MFVNRRLAGALLALLILSTGGTALAAPITGTLDLSVLDPDMNGADLAASTEVSGTDIFTVALPPATLDFSAVPIGTSFGPFMLDKTNLAGEFTFTNATLRDLRVQLGAHSYADLPNLLVVQLLGIFTPGSGLPGFDATSARIDVTVELRRRLRAAPWTGRSASPPWAPFRCRNRPCRRCWPSAVWHWRDAGARTLSSGPTPRQTARAPVPPRRAR